MSEPLTQLTIDAALRGGEVLRQIAGRPRQVMRKGFRDDVTDADYAAQEAIYAAIRTRYPDAPIVSEENDLAHQLGGAAPGGLWWLIDPLDGTTNFSRNIPQYCVSVAVLEGETVLGGAVYDPVREHVFAAARGAGATLNSAPIHVTARDQLAEAVLECGLGRGRADRARSLAVYRALATHARSVRSLGAAALSLAYVAAGWLDGYFHLTLSPWDIAAGVLLVEEAGGTLTRAGEGGALRQRQAYAPMLASNGVLHDEICTLALDAIAALDETTP